MNAASHARLQVLRDELDAADEAGELACARELCEHILKLSPDDRGTLMLYADALTNLRQFEAAAEAIDRLEALELGQKTFPVLSLKANLAYKRGAYGEALRLYLTLHTFYPDDASWLNLAGNAAFRSGDFLQAEELHRRATSCAEGPIDEAWFNLGGCLLSQQRYEEAKDCYRRALKIDPDYTEAKHRLADLEKLGTLLYLHL